MGAVERHEILINPSCGLKYRPKNSQSIQLSTPTTVHLRFMPALHIDQFLP